MWLGYVNSIPLLILDFCLIQFWVNVATSPYQAMIPDMVPKDRQGTASAYMGMSTLLGQLAGFVIYGFLGAPLPVTMAIISTLMVFCMAYSVWRLPEPSAKDNPAPKGSIFGTLAEAFRINPREHPDFMRLIASRFMINMGFYTCTAILSYYVAFTLGANNHDQVLTTIMLIATVSGLVGNFPAGILSDRVSKKVVVYVSNTITGAAVLCFALTGSVWVAMVAAFVFGVGLGAFQAVDWAFATNLLPQRDEAKYMGVWHVAFTVPQVVAPLIGLPVAYYVNTHATNGLGYRATMLLALAYFVIGTLMIRPIKEKVVVR
jgi:MFS family permease